MTGNWKKLVEIRAHKNGLCDNLCSYSIKTYTVTHHYHCFIEVILMRGLKLPKSH